MPRLSLFLLCAGLLWTYSSFGQTVTKPAQGSPIRKALMDAIRKPIEIELKQSVVFTPSFLNATADWAFGLMSLSQPGGKPIDYRHTAYWEAVKEGFFDNGVSVLWQRKNGIWIVQTYVLGATDVPYGCWWKKFGAPKAVLQYAETNCQ